MHIVKSLNLNPSINTKWGPNDDGFNILEGRHLHRGNPESLKNGIWTGKDDPCFSTALTLIEHQLDIAYIDSNPKGPYGITDIPRDEAELFVTTQASMLLWSCIERHITLSQNWGSLLMRHLKKFFKDDITFKKWLRSEGNLLEYRSFYSSAKPGTKYSLEPEDPENHLIIFIK